MKLWAWMAQMEDGRWTQIGAIVPGFGQGQLTHINEDIVRTGMRAVAEAHHRQSGQPIKLVEFESVAEYDPFEGRPQG